ncbi:MAG: U32 family peptidase [Candidatus Hydrogenedentes bacterium]|nr:U32 family peptidase [Candidatus Hydrogenedentota bacterium]
MPADIRILAPVASFADAQLIIAAGADLVYCGYLPTGWGAQMGELESISRRQGRPAHITDEGELAAVAEFARSRGCEALLTLNGHYTPLQAAQVLHLAERWEQLGGTGLMVADIGLIATLHERGSTLTLCASILTGVFNSATVHFLAGLGATRVVLPRELSLEEVCLLTSSAPVVEYEMIVLHQRCPFIDGFCRFYHGSRIPDGLPAAFPYTITKEGNAVAALIDPDYEGHGCQLNWHTDEGDVGLQFRPDECEPPCAACRLSELAAAGVSIAKVAGRGYPPDLIARSVAFLAQARAFGHGHDAAAMIRDLYRETFGTACSEHDCYYGAPGGTR